MKDRFWPAAVQRFRLVRSLADAGVPVTVMMAPVIPALNDGEIEAIIERAAAALERVEDIVNDEERAASWSSRAVNLQVGVPGLIYSWDLATNPGWTTQGEWAFGQPTGQGGAWGDPDARKLISWPLSIRLWKYTTGH